MPKCLRTPVSPKRRGEDVIGRLKYTVKKINVPLIWKVREIIFFSGQNS
jgi:hypothetical protein